MVRECTWDVPCTGADTQIVSCTRDDIGCVMSSVDGGWSDWQAEGSCCNGSQTLRRTCTNPIQSGNGADCVGSETEIQSCEVESDSCPSDVDQGADSSTTDETSGVASETEETNEDSGNAETTEGSATQDAENTDSINASDPISDSETGDEPAGSDTEVVEDTTNENGIGNNEDSTPVDETSESSNGSSSVGSEPTGSVENIDGGWSQWRNAPLCCNGVQEFVRTCDSPSRSGMGEPCKGKATEQLNCYPDTCIPEDIDGGWSEWQAESKCCNGVRIMSRTCTNPVPSGKGSLCLGQAREAEACYTNDCDDVVEGDWLPWEDETKCCNGIKTVSRSCKFGSVCTGPTLSTQNCYPDTCSEEASEKLDGWSSWTPVGFCCLGKQPYTRTCEAPELGCEGTQRDDRPCTFGEICAGMLESLRSILTDGTQDRKRLSLLLDVFCSRKGSQADNSTGFGIAEERLWREDHVTMLPARHS